jgi:hypothetical protein
VEQSHEVGLALGRAEAGYQARRLFASFRTVDRLLIRARFDRALELSEPFAEPAHVLATALVVRRDTLREVIEHAPEGLLGHCATLGPR